MRGERIVIFGGGFAGCLMARQLVEEGYRVEIIESTNHLGGLLRRVPDATMQVWSSDALRFYQHTVQLSVLDLEQRLYRPIQGYEVLCNQLVDHKNISVTMRTPVYEPLWQKFFAGAISTVSPDRLCRMVWGELPYDTSLAYPQRTPERIQAHGYYLWVMSTLGIISIGNKACFQMFSMREIWEQTQEVIKLYGKLHYRLPTTDEPTTRPMDASRTGGGIPDAHVYSPFRA